MRHINRLSSEWLRLVSVALNSRGREVCPAVATVQCASDDDYGDDALRQDLDQLLDDCSFAKTDTVASTIFPHFLWNPNSPRERLRERYFKILPRIRKQNPRGTYFERLVSYPGTKDKRGFNQLDHIIATYKGGNHRRSALQASLVVPERDLDTNAPVLGFPCLHQVGFLPNSKTKKLVVVAYYPMQYLLERAYGNYLGLIRLGKFVAAEMEFECDKLICMAGVAKLEGHVPAVKKLLTKYS